MNTPNILTCPYCGKKSNWVDYVGNQYKRVCPFCQRKIEDIRSPEVSDGNCEKEAREETS